MGILLLLTFLAGCSTLPSAGPSPRSIEKNAAVALVSDERHDTFHYALIDISKSILPYFDATTRRSLRDGFGGGRGTPSAVTLGIGDVVQLTIFESQSGGLFLPAEGGTRSGNYVTLPALAIDNNGYINVPYAGPVRVAGRAASDVQTEIEGLLANRAIEPQVVITTTLSRSNRLSILGAVNSPSELDLSPRGERVLDIISRAGGLTSPDQETYVTIERNGRTATALFETLIDDPSENIFVQPGDTIHVYRERRTYLAFGATSASGRLDFEESNLTFGEALAKVGGLLDGRADPQEVFLYRLVDRAILRQLGIDTASGPGSDPVIFRADLRNPATLFAVQEFLMVDKDMIYVGNAESSELSKFLDMINGISNTTANIPANLVTTRNALDAL